MSKGARADKFGSKMMDIGMGVRHPIRQSVSHEGSLRDSLKILRWISPRTPIVEAPPHVPEPTTRDTSRLRCATYLSRDSSSEGQPYRTHLRNVFSQDGGHETP